MINSLMSRMGAAEKLTVAQLQQAVKDGTLPAYVGIPLIQDKMKQQQEAQAGKPVPPQPPVAEQVLMAADQRRGIDEASSNLPEMSAAEGGIMSYAAGGDVDAEDYEDYLQQAQDEQDLEFANMAAENQGIAAVAKEPAYVNKTPSVQPAMPAGEGTQEKLLSHILRKESGGRRYGKDGKLLQSSEGALGEMQVLPATAMNPGFGIKPAKDINDADEIARVGREYAAALLQKYKDPFVAAAAYNWGPGNVDKWLAKGADRSKLPTETQKYIADASFAAGGIADLTKHYDGTDDSLVAADNPALQRSYAVNEGIRNLASAAVDPNTYNPIPFLLKNNPYSVYQREIGQPFEKWTKMPLEEQAAKFEAASNARKNVSLTNTSAPPSSSKALLASQPADVAPIDTAERDRERARATATAGVNQRDIAAGNLQTPPSVKNILDSTFTGDQFQAPEAAGKAPKEESMWDKYLAGLNMSREELRAQKDEDKYLAILAAGLGTLKAAGTIEPGKVHTGLGDISTGGMEGLAYAANAAKSRAAQEIALNKEMGTGLYRQELIKSTGGNRNAQLDISRAALEEKKREFAGKQLEGKDKQIRDQVLHYYKLDPTKALSDPDVAASIERQIALAKQKDPTYNVLHKNYYGFDYATPVASGDNVMRFDKTGKQV